MATNSTCSYSLRVRHGAADSTQRAALEKLYQAHGAMIHARCRRILRDRAAAEDATHETFLRVRRYVGVRTQDELLPLLCRIATNYCLKVLRTRRVRSRVLDTEVHTHALGADDTLLQRFHALHTLRQLPEQMRAVAVLTYAAGMTQEEVARSLGISRRTVVHRLTELRKSSSLQPNAA